MKSVFVSFFFLSAALTGFAQTSDETAIKSVVEKEGQTFFNNDVPGFLSCWANVPYALQLVHYGAGIAYRTNEKTDFPAQIAAFFATRKPDASTFKNAGYMIHINGNAAFAQFNQTMTAPDGTQQYFFHEARYLEKINGAWKIVYVGAVLDKAPGK